MNAVISNLAADNFNTDNFNADNFTTTPISNIISFSGCTPLDCNPSDCNPSNTTTNNTINIITNNTTHPKAPNYNTPSQKGTRKEVYAFSNADDIRKVSEYLLYHSSEKQEYRLRNYLFFSLGINMGFRASDLVMLKWSNVFTPDLNWNNTNWNTITEQKTGKNRMVVINSAAQRAIKFYFSIIPIETISLDDYIFTSRKKVNGKLSPMKPDNMRVIIKNAAEAVGIPFNVGTHSMRKTFGRNLYISSGNDVGLVSSVLNHSSQQMTLRYIGIDQDNVRNAYEGMDDLVFVP